MAYFRCNTTEIFIFSLKYRQQKVDLNTSKKSLVFVTIRHKIYLRAAVVYENFIFTQKYAFAERCCFLRFSFEGKLKKYDISVKRKHTKTNKNMFFSALFTNFCKTKNNFFIQCGWKSGDGVHILFTIPGAQFALKITKSMKWLFKGRE